MVKKWDPRTLSNRCTILVLGKRNRGKSTAVIDLCRFVKAPKGIVFSATDHCAHVFDKIFPARHVVADLTEEKLEHLIRVQKNLTAKDKRFEKTGCLLVIDDVGFDRRFWQRSKALSEIMCNGRHYNFTVILALQDAVSLPPALRAQLDLVFCLAEAFASNQKRLYEFFFGMFDEQTSFRKCLQECTRDYGMLVLDNRSADPSDLAQTVFWYRAQHGLDYKFGKLR